MLRNVKFLKRVFLFVNCYFCQNNGLANINSILSQLEKKTFDFDYFEIKKFFFHHDPKKNDTI